MFKKFSILILIPICLMMSSVSFADNLTADPQPSEVVTKYRIDLNGEILNAEIRAAEGTQVQLYYNIDHLPDGKYLAFAAAGNNEGDWSEWSESLEFYRGIPTPQNINLFCGIEVEPTPAKISQQDWKILNVSSESTQYERFGWMAIDGDLSTHWLADTVAIYPHEIQIDLGRTYQISGFYHTARIEGTWTVSADIKEYAFRISLDGVNWTEVSAGVMTEQLVEFTPQAARYVSLVAVSELNNTTRVAVAEINILGY